MTRSPIGCVLCLTLFLLAGALPSAADEEEGDFSRGAKYYSDNCGRCHNFRSAVELRDRDWSIVMTHMRVTAGLPGGQARDIKTFLQRSSYPPQPQSVAKESALTGVSGEVLIDRFACRGCHVIDGRGGTVGLELDSVFERRDVEWIRVQIQHPREHNPATVMPDLGLTDSQVEAVIESLGAD